MPTLILLDYFFVCQIIFCMLVNKVSILMRLSLASVINVPKRWILSFASVINVPKRWIFVFILNMYINVEYLINISFEISDLYALVILLTVPVYFRILRQSRRQIIDSKQNDI